MFKGKNWLSVRERVIDFLNSLGKLEKEKIVVAYSGGKDSLFLLCCLLSLRKKYKYELFPVYVQHNLIPENDLYSRIALLSTKKLGMACEMINLPSKTDENINLEHWMRNERYKILENYREKIDAKFIAVAHHQNDQVETILMHLFRGTGIWGLKGMKSTYGNIIRPILDVSKKEIDGLISETTLPYYDDKTNFYLDYKRNKIRHELIPEIQIKFDPQIGSHLMHLAEQSNELSRFVKLKKEEFINKLNINLEEKENIIVDVEKWKEIPGFFQKEILYSILNKMAYEEEASYEFVIRLNNWIVGNGTGEFRLKKIRVTRVKKLIAISHKP